jgi:hypothetical protein
MQEQRAQPELLADFRCLDRLAVELKTNAVNFVLFVSHRLNAYALLL